MKTLLTIGMSCTALVLSSFAQLLHESFDYGTGVPERNRISYGAPFNLIEAQIGQGTWRTTGDGSTFAGSAGLGNGALDMTTATNTTASIPLDFSASTLTSSTEFTMTTQGLNGSAGFYFGFQASAPDNQLLTNQLTDTIWVKVSPTRIGFRMRINGITENQVGNINWSPGSSGRIQITYEQSNNTATAIVTNEGKEIYRDTNAFPLPSEYTPELGALALNTVTMDTISVKGVYVAIPEPQTAGMLLIAFGYSLIARRNNSKHNI